MKIKIVTLFLIILTIFMLSSCSSDEESNSSSSRDENYDIVSSYFKITDYDFKTYTKHNLKTGEISETYSFDFETKCEYPLTEYKATIKFYSSQDKLLFEDTVKESNYIKANESFEISLDVSDNVFEKAYEIKVTLSGTSSEKPEDSTTSKATTLKYCAVSFIDNGDTIAQLRVKKGQTVDEDQAFSPSKSNHIFYGWFLDRQLTQSVIFPLEVTSDINIYADWLKTYEKTTCANTKIKDWAGNDSAVAYLITPSGFDFDKLEKEGYRLQIKVTYDVYYKKDYDAPLDIGYAGPPKYDAYILKSDGKSLGKSDLSTTTSSKTRTIEASLTFSDIKNEKLTLQFSTDNIQNLIYFKNIIVEYSCVK